MKKNTETLDERKYVYMPDMDDMEYTEYMVVDIALILQESAPLGIFDIARKATIPPSLTVPQAYKELETALQFMEYKGYVKNPKAGYSLTADGRRWINNYDPVDKQFMLDKLKESNDQGEVLTVELAAQISEEYELEPGDRIRVVKAPLTEGHHFDIADFIAGAFSLEEKGDPWYVAEDITTGVYFALQQIYPDEQSYKRALRVLKDNFAQGD